MTDKQNNSKLAQLDNRHTTTDTEDSEPETVENTELDEEQSNESDEPSEEEVNWKPLTLYLTDGVHTEFSKPFFMRLQLENPHLMQGDYMKREFQQAAVEVAMEHEEEVAARAEEIHNRVNDN